MAPNLNGLSSIILFQGAQTPLHRRNEGVPRGPAPPPPIEMLPKIKMSQKRLLFRQFQYFLASSRTAVINNSLDIGGPAPLNLIFTNQFKWVPYNNIYPGGPGSLNLIFANQFKWAPTIIFKSPPI